MLKNKKVETLSELEAILYRKTYEAENYERGNSDLLRGLYGIISDAGLTEDFRRWERSRLL